jgi:hypothetical protein
VPGDPNGDGQRTSAFRLADRASVYMLARNEGGAVVLIRWIG